jgi:microcystin-dependent protein
MPRNSQGLYTLPLPPVVPGTLIETTWANPTTQDIADALTASLPRDGSAPMVGPLILRADPPTQPREAISKGYLEQFLAYATGMPVGSVFAFAAAAAPAGYLLCNGQAVSRTTYAALWAVIGTTYGSGDGSTTFNVPDMRGEFIRGKPDGRPLGNKQAGSFAAHTHGVSDPGHGHTGVAAAHTHPLNAHTHGVNDPGHSHSSTGMYAAEDSDGSGVTDYYPNTIQTGASLTGISVQAAGDFGMGASAPGVTVNANTTGITLGATGGTETVPQNIALDYYIKAIDDATQSTSITGITSSDEQMIGVDNTNPVVPHLVIHSNVAFGTVKLDASGRVPLNLIPNDGAMNLLGYFDASTNQNPSEKYPATTFNSGDTYVISVTGTIDVFDPATLVSSPTIVTVGSMLQYVDDSPTNPTGWYYTVVTSSTVASQISFVPSGTVQATNVQAAIDEVASEKVAKSGDTMTGPLTNTNAIFVQTTAPSIPAVWVGHSEGNQRYIGYNNPTSDLVFNNVANDNIVAGISNEVVPTNAYHLTRKDYVDNNIAVAKVAANVAFTPSGTISAANVQSAIQELDTDTQNSLASKVSKSGDTMTGLLVLPESRFQSSGDPKIEFNIPGVAAQLGYLEANGFTWGQSNGAGSLLSPSYKVNADNSVVFYQPIRGTFGSTSGTLLRTYSGPGSQLGFTYNGANLVANVDNSIEIILQSASDARIKDNVRPVEDALPLVAALKPCRFRYKTSGEESIGFIAQEFGEVIPELRHITQKQPVDGAMPVDDKDGNMQSINYGQLTAVLVKAIQELSAKVADLEARLP